MNKQIPNSLMKFLIYFTTPYKLGMIGMAICITIAGCYGAVNSYLTKVLIDIVENCSNTTKLFDATILTVILIVANFEAHNLSWRIYNAFQIKYLPKIKNSITEQLFSYIHMQHLRFFQDNFAGTIASNIARAAQNTETIIYNSMFLLRGAIQLSFALFAMYFVHPLFSLILFIWMFAFLSAIIFCSNKVKMLSDDYAMSESILAGKVTDSINSVSNVRIFAAEVFERNYLQKYLGNMRDKFRARDYFVLKLNIAKGLSVSTLVGAVLFLLIKLRSDNLITLGDFALILGLTLHITDNMWWLSEQIDQMNNAVGQATQAITNIMVPHEIVDAVNAKNLIVTEGKIKFQDVSFSYLGKNHIFNNKSIVIEGGQKVGLVGFSGSGKTTFVNLIVRLFDINSGEITIDGQNIAHVTQKSLRKNISFIPQDPVLFHRSVLENIRYGRQDASDQEVINAARLAHADYFITQIAEGYDALVGERGVKLSGGQRQRISIARAILKNSKILILDEATSALDSVTESQIEESLKSMMQDKTSLVIAHRLSTLLNMDRIIVFDQGKIVEDGTHIELLKLNGTYNKLWNSQKDGFIQENI